MYVSGTHEKTCDRRRNCICIYNSKIQSKSFTATTLVMDRPLGLSLWIMVNSCTY